SDAVLSGLGEMGFVDGRNMIADYRWAEGHYERLPTYAAELVRRPCSVILTIGGSLPALAAKAATSTIPIVFAFGLDPVSTGLVPSLNKPTGNVTGVTTLSTDLVPKCLELLREAVGGSGRFGLLLNPGLAANPSPLAEEMMRRARDAANLLNVQLTVV